MPTFRRSAIPGPLGQRTVPVHRAEVALLRRPAAPLVAVAAAFVLAGGAIHLRQWLDYYRHIPASIPGAAVVRIGFPLNTAASLALAGALIATIFRFRRLAPMVLAAALGFQTASLAALVLTRSGRGLFGWVELGWAGAPTLTRALELGAITALVAAVVVARYGPARRPRAETAAPRPGLAGSGRP